MRMSRYILIGILLGIVLYKSEAVSWFRIYEMFKFQSFHMFGIIGSAVIAGILIVQVIKKRNVRTVTGEPIVIKDKANTIPRYLVGGFIFGLGWAMTGACPGPLFAQIGTGATVIVVTLLSAIAGTWVYGYFRDRLPH